MGWTVDNTRAAPRGTTTDADTSTPGQATTPMPSRQRCTHERTMPATTNAPTNIKVALLPPLSVRSVSVT